MPTRSTNFNLRGFNHIALTCADMQNTVDFYEGILGFPLIKTLDLAERRKLYHEVQAILEIGRAHV